MAYEISLISILEVILTLIIALFIICSSKDSTKNRASSNKSGAMGINKVPVQGEHKT